ncbi:MAG: glucose-1-phosphate cytidylyltransferase [Erysipelotrichaceae bacterium]|nr:glucose-1-phosphate cytidylyltransferase [Erysipelotrichaceae bacterium]
MKVVILAGGYGTRISEESYLKPKPMIEICGKPIMWHIMKYYSSYGFNEFIICAGYKQEYIKRWFRDYCLTMSDVTFDFGKSDNIIIHSNKSEPWKVTVVDTGLDTMTGGRIKRIKDYISEEKFLLTYGDGLSNVDLLSLIEFHNKSNSILTLSAVEIESRFGILDICENGKVSSFREKSKFDTEWINGGYMVADKKIFDYIDGDGTIFEKYTIETLVNENKLSAYKHRGFWQCMDTIRDKNKLENLIETNNAPWMVW